MATDHKRDEHGVITLQPGEVYEGETYTLPVGFYTDRRMALAAERNHDIKAQRDELLAVCRTMVEADINDVTYDDGDCCQSSELQAILRRARAAISKAEDR